MAIFLSQLPMFGCILLKHFDNYINQQWKWNPCQNDNSKPVYIGTKSPVYHSIACKLGPTSIYFLFSFKVYKFRSWNFVKVDTFWWEIYCIKIQKVEFLQNESDFAIIISQRLVYMPTYFFFKGQVKKNILASLQI